MEREGEGGMDGGMDGWMEGEIGRGREVRRGRNVSRNQRGRKSEVGIGREEEGKKVRKESAGGREGEMKGREAGK